MAAGAAESGATADAETGEGVTAARLEMEAAVDTPGAESFTGTGLSRDPVSASVLAVAAT